MEKAAKKFLQKRLMLIVYLFSAYLSVYVLLTHYLNLTILYDRLAEKSFLGISFVVGALVFLCVLMLVNRSLKFLGALLLLFDLAILLVLLPFTGAVYWVPLVIGAVNTLIVWLDPDGDAFKYCGKYIWYSSMFYLCGGFLTIVLYPTVLIF